MDATEAKDKLGALIDRFVADEYTGTLILNFHQGNLANKFEKRKTEKFNEVRFALKII